MIRNLGGVGCRDSSAINDSSVIKFDQSQFEALIIVVLMTFMLIAPIR